MSELSRRYALALYEVAKEADQIEKVWNQLNQFKESLNDTEIQSFLLDESIQRKSKEEILFAVFKSHQPILANFLMTLIAHHRFAHYQDIVADYYEINLEDHQQVIAKVETPSELDEANQKLLREALSKKYGKNIVLDITIKPELLSGLKVSIGQDVLDNSLLNKMKQLHLQLKQGG